MADSSKLTRAEAVLLFNKIITGVNRNVTASILLGGQLKSQKQIVAVFSAAIQANNALVAAETAYQRALVAQRTAFATAYATEASLKSYVIGAYGKTDPILTEFGFSVVKEAVKSAAAKAEAVVKSAATRLARGTKGPKAKLSIQGTVSPAESAAAQPVVTTPSSK